MTSRWFIFAFLLFALASCKKPPAPAPTTQPERDMVLLIPGLGEPDLGAVRDMLTSAFPDLNVVDFGTGRNSYLADVAGYANANPHKRLALIGHSYGCDRLSRTIPQVGDVALVVMIDPVHESGTPPLAIPANVGHAIIISADFSGLIRGPVKGAYDEYKVHRDHVGVASDPKTLDIIRSAVAGVL